MSPDPSSKVQQVEVIGKHMTEAEEAEYDRMYAPFAEQEINTVGALGPLRKPVVLEKSQRAFEHAAEQADKEADARPWYALSRFEGARLTDDQLRTRNELDAVKEIYSTLPKNVTRNDLENARKQLEESARNPLVSGEKYLQEQRAYDIYKRIYDPETGSISSGVPIKKVRDYFESEERRVSELQASMRVMNAVVDMAMARAGTHRYQPQTPLARPQMVPAMNGRAPMAVPMAQPSMSAYPGARAPLPGSTVPRSLTINSRNGYTIGKSVLSEFGLPQKPGVGNVAQRYTDGRGNSVQSGVPVTPDARMGRAKIEARDAKDAQSTFTKLSRDSRAYLRDIEAQTGFTIGSAQRSSLADALRENSYSRLNVQDTKAYRNEWTPSVKNKLIKEWESQTESNWPRYSQQEIDSLGITDRRAGMRYDAHEIIPNSYGGPREWWNVTPARYPDQHQGGIHRKGGVFRIMFNE